MKTQSVDTNPIVEEKLIKILRESSVPERLSKVFKLSSLTRQLSYRALARRNPGVNKQELDLLFIKLVYGEELYNKVSQYYKDSAYGKR